jgi:uncharacterized protein YrrD
MYIAASHLSRLPVMSLQTGEAVAVLDSAVVTTSQLQTVAFLCHAVDNPRHQHILLTNDIRQITDDCFIVDSLEDLAEPGDIVRLQELLAEEYSPLGAGVVTDTGRRLGSVKDFSINSDTMYVQKLYVRPSLLFPLHHETAIIDRTQIVDITPKRIVVRDTTEPAPVISIEGLPTAPS